MFLAKADVMISTVMGVCLKNACYKINSTHSRFVNETNHFFDKVKRKIKVTNHTLYIGIHVRRTDFTQFMLGKYNMKPLKPAWFLEAMDRMKAELNDSQVSKQTFIKSY